MTEQQQVDEVHLVKIRVTSKTSNQIRIECPFLKNFVPKVELKYNTPLYLPLIQRIYLSKDINNKDKNMMVPVDISTLLQYPFDTHNIKMQTYQDPQRTQKSEQITMSIQFALALTVKGKVNYLDVDFKFAHLKKSLVVMGKMSPYFTVRNDSWHYTSQASKQGHLSPQFNDTVNIEFHSVFDKVEICLKHQGQTIGASMMYIFEFIGKQQDRVTELQKDFKMVGTLTYTAIDFEPEDF